MVLVMLFVTGICGPFRQAGSRSLVQVRSPPRGVDAWQAQRVDLSFLSHMTFFLLARCSAKRVNELHALSVSEQRLWWIADDTGVLPWSNPSFFLKVVN